MLQPLGLQVGGHGQGDMPGKAILDTGDKILKPLQEGGRGNKEIAFYEQVFDGSTDIPAKVALRSFLPQYHGMEAHEEEGTDTESHYMVLENVIRRFSKPCILDLKMGRQTYAPTARPEKAARENAKYPQQRDIGFRFVGMKVYEPATGEYRSYEREYGYGLAESELPGAFQAYLNNKQGMRTDVVAGLVGHLQRLLGWFEAQHLYAFYGSSVLLVYEGDTQAAHPDAVEMRMIDFPHVLPMDSPDGLDEGYIYGLKRLIAYLQALVP
eukprot:comp23736_c0_seq1/m.40946 comp23736_c0_seq1/g.40946  ORF comp23736_c0_seq1/g.40946 comp23736_c0_seq1/m.40946 type:complete len:268 (-) comp23736_c0_seq1:520-1323(-)